jgi:hypothetical protein
VNWLETITCAAGIALNGAVIAWAMIQSRKET